MNIVTMWYDLGFNLWILIMSIQLCVPWILGEYFVDLNPCRIRKSTPNILINPSQLWTPYDPNSYSLIGTKSDPKYTLNKISLLPKNISYIANNDNTHQKKLGRAHYP